MAPLAPGIANGAMMAHAIMYFMMTIEDRGASKRPYKSQLPVIKWVLIILLLLRTKADAFSFRYGFRANRRAKLSSLLPLLATPSVNGEGVVSEKKARDSVALFEADVTKVIRELRPWPNDPAVPAYFGAKRLSFTNYWDLDDWERHNSRWRFVRYMRGLPTSRLLRRIAPQMTGLVVWSLFAVALHSRSVVFGRVNVPLSALTLISTFVAALLMLRSNQGLSRLAMGRDAMGKSVLLTRDTAMLFATYIYPKNEILGLKAGRLITFFFSKKADEIQQQAHALTLCSQQYNSSPPFSLWLDTQIAHSRHWSSRCCPRSVTQNHECLLQVCSSSKKAASGITESLESNYV